MASPTAVADRGGSRGGRVMPSRRTAERTARERPEPVGIGSDAGGDAHKPWIPRRGSAVAQRRRAALAAPAAPRRRYLRPRSTTGTGPRRRPCLLYTSDAADEEDSV